MSRKRSSNNMSSGNDEPELHNIEDVYPKLVPRQCEVCKKTENVSLCGGCQTYWYCSRDHQVTGRASHKNTCNTIKAAKTTAQNEEAKLRAQLGDGNTPADIFETHRGQLGQITAARPFLHAKFKVAETLLRSWRLKGIQDALATCLELLQLDHSDPHSCRQFVPSLYLRLGRDQECYDFLKWWAIELKNRQANVNGLQDFIPDVPGHYQSIEISRPFLDIHGADVLDPVDLWTDYPRGAIHLCDATALLLVKIRLLQNLQGVEKFVKYQGLGKNIEQVLEDDDFRSQVRGDYFTKRPELVLNGALSRSLDTLAGQMKQLLEAIMKYNQHLIPMLAYPDEGDLTGPLSMYARGTRSEAMSVLQHTYSAFCETDGSIEGLRNTFLQGQA